MGADWGPPGGGPPLTRTQRLALLTLRLITRPGLRWSLRDLAAGTGVGRSTVSADLEDVRQALAEAGAGRLEAASGPGGGVRYVPAPSPQRLRQVVHALAEALARPDRVLAGGFLFMTDLLFSPEWARLIGECFVAAFAGLSPDVVVTVETKGVPIAMMTARAFGVPLVLLRRDARVTEGPSVSINYVSGSARRIQSMSVPRRSLVAGSRALVIDDFMKGGGTARGMCDLLGEVGAVAAGIGVVVATDRPTVKKVEDFRSLLILEQPDDDGRPLRLRPAPWVQAGAEAVPRGARAVVRRDAT